MAAILVTGGAGYIGSHTCKALAGKGLVPVTFDNLSRGHADFVKWGPLVVGDILDQAALDDTFRRYKPEAVIHFAALAYVGESFSEPLAYYKVNVGGTISILEAMAKHDTKKIVFSSSCATYGIPVTIPISETAPQRPISPYGRSKLACEHIVKDAAFSHSFRFAILRYFNACGADSSGTLMERHRPETHLIPLAIDAAIGKGPPLHIFGMDYPTSDGTCERDFVHVSDLAVAHVEALHYLDKNKRSFEVNLGSGQAHSVSQIVSTVEQIIGRPIPVIWSPRRPGDPPSLYSDVSVAQRILNFCPQYSNLETIIKTTWRSRL